VPIVSLDDAIKWVEDTFVTQGSSLTRVILDGNDVLENFPHRKHSIDSKTRLEFRIDAPEDLAIGAVEAMTNLSSIVLRSIKAIAVECWEIKPHEVPQNIDELISDIELIAQLIDHLDGLINVDKYVTGAYREVIEQIMQAKLKIGLARGNSDWKGLAKLLLQRVELLLNRLSHELEAVILQLLSHKNSSAEFLPQGKAPVASA
jgi:hypothetical protein